MRLKWQINTLSQLNKLPKESHQRGHPGYINQRVYINMRLSFVTKTTVLMGFKRPNKKRKEIRLKFKKGNTVSKKCLILNAFYNMGLCLMGAQRQLLGTYDKLYLFQSLEYHFILLNFFLREFVKFVWVFKASEETFSKSSILCSSVF